MAKAKAKSKRKSKSKRKGTSKQKSYSRAKGRKSRGGRRVRRLGGRARYRTWRSLTKKYGPKRAAKKWRRRTKYVRSNPFSGLMPSMGSVTTGLKSAASLGAGWVAANGVLLLADKVGLSSLKDGKSPGVRAAIDFAVRLLTAPIVGKVLGKVGIDSQKAALGAAFNALYHGVQAAVAANATAVPESAKSLLLGYDGYGDTGYGVGSYLTPSMGVGGYLTASDLGMGGVNPILEANPIY